MAESLFNFGDIFKTGASPYAGFMSPAMQQQMRGQQMGAIGAGLLESARPRAGLPPPVGAGLAQGFTAAANIGQQSVGNALMLQNWKAQQAAATLAAEERERVGTFRTAIGADPDLSDLGRAARAAYPQVFAGEMAEAAYREPTKPSYKKKNEPIGGGKFQRWESLDGGVNWEKVGKPYDQYDPLVQFDFQDDEGNINRAVALRSEIDAMVVTAREGGGGPAVIGTRPSPAKVKRETGLRALETMQTNLASYREALEGYGVSPLGAIGIPPVDATALESKAEALRLDLKTLYELGALVGGDFVILDRLLTNPATTTGVLKGKDGLLAQLDELENQLNLKVGEKLRGAGREPSQAKRKFSDYSVEDLNAVTADLLAQMPPRMLDEYEAERKRRGLD